MISRVSSTLDIPLQLWRRLGRAASYKNKLAQAEIRLLLLLSSVFCCQPRSRVITTVVLKWNIKLQQCLVFCGFTIVVIINKQCYSDSKRCQGSERRRLKQAKKEIDYQTNELHRWTLKYLINLFYYTNC